MFYNLIAAILHRLFRARLFYVHHFPLYRLLWTLLQGAHLHFHSNLVAILSLIAYDLQLTSYRDNSFNLWFYWTWRGLHLNYSSVIDKTGVREWTERGWWKVKLIVNSTNYPRAREKWIRAAVKACRSRYFSPADGRYAPPAVVPLPDSQRVCEPTEEGPPPTPPPPFEAPEMSNSSVTLNGRRDL